VSISRQQGLDNRTLALIVTDLEGRTGNIVTACN
jgi:hypothetical protein